MSRPRSRQLVITSGDPSGIGPEVILKALRRVRPGRRPVTVIGSLAVFRAAARRARVPLPRWAVHTAVTSAAHAAEPLVLLDCVDVPGRFVPGRSTRGGGAASLGYLFAAWGLWRAGALAALVTGPVSKASVAASWPGFTGHTEFLAGLTASRGVVMMFASERLRVALVTRHVPLRDVARSVTPALFEHTVRTVHAAVRTQFKVRRPRLAALGINPHAGEASPRSEEARALWPVLRRLRRAGIACDGPFPGDGFFAAHLGRYDAVISPYHDQGLIPFKLLARDTGCQVSLGLPFVRTSPDHGTAFDIAGRGAADPGSMAYAIAQAARLC